MSLASLKKFTASLRQLPRVVAHKVAEASAGAISAEAQTTFDAGETPYGTTWAPGVGGDKITLRETGALARGLRYVAIGTKLRVVLGVPYAKYQIGKRPVFPRQGGELPTGYVRTLEQSTAAVIRAEVES